MATDLRVGHLNICHLENKVSDLCVLLQQPTPFHLFGVTESWLHSDIPDIDIEIPGYSMLRRDPSRPHQTGIAVYIHNSVSPFTRRRHDLESDRVEGLWVEIKTNKSAPVLVSIIYRHKTSTFEWCDDFVTMMDGAGGVSPNVVILGDFNNNLFKPHPAWDSTVR